MAWPVPPAAASAAASACFVLGYVRFVAVRKGSDDRSYFSFLSGLSPVRSTRAPRRGRYCCIAQRAGDMNAPTIAALRAGPQPDFAVIGGGLCGRLVAWRLAGAGHRVALY